MKINKLLLPVLAILMVNCSDEIDEDQVSEPLLEYTESIEGGFGIDAGDASIDFNEE